MYYTATRPTVNDFIAILEKLRDSGMGECTILVTTLLGQTETTIELHYADDTDNKTIELTSY